MIMDQQTLKTMEFWLAPLNHEDPKPKAAIELKNNLFINTTLLSPSFFPNKATLCNNE